jgi:hypothetical protein
MRVLVIILRECQIWESRLRQDLQSRAALRYSILMAGKEREFSVLLESIQQGTES